MLFPALLAVTLLQTGEPAPPEAFDAQARVTEALDILRREAYRRDAVDWAVLEHEARAGAAKAADNADMLRVYARMLDSLGDGHSFVQADPAVMETYRARHGEAFDAFRVYKPVTSTFTARNQPEARTLALTGRGSAELVVVPKVFGGGRVGVPYATALFDHIAAAAVRVCGYVVDLRGNQGGNVWHMKAGASALLGDSYLNNDPFARFENGAFVVNEGEYAGATMTAATTWRALPALAEAPVAVLIDDGVGSSGEGMAVAFKGRIHTRFFGQTTAGVASVNNGFMLKDGVNLVVTIAMMADRNGAIYPDGVPPDEVVVFGPGDETDPDDAQIEAAKRWLAQAPQCRAS